MSNVPALAPLSSISDENTRIVLQRLYDAWHARSNGSEKFLTGNDLATGLQSVNITGSSTGSLSGLNNPFTPEYLAWVKPMLQTIEDTMQQSRLYKELTTTADAATFTANESLQLAQSIEGSVNGSWTVKFNAAGQAIGVGLGLEGKNGTVESSFVVVADKFMVARPDGTGAIPMMEMGVVNGVNVLGFKGTLVSADGIFTGQLSAANGSFTGELIAATGTFGGRLMAGVLDLGSLTGVTEYRSSPGTYYFTLNADQTMIRYQIIAGGGGGGSGKGGEWNTPAGGGGGGGAGQYLSGTLTLSAGAQIRVIVGGGGAGANSWASYGGSGSPTYIQYFTGTSWVTVVYANPGGGGAGAPQIYYDNADNDVINGGGGGGYPGGGSGPNGDTSEGGSASGGYGATTVWGTGGSPGWPNVGWGSGGNGYGSGGGGGAGYHGWRHSGADWNHGLFGGGGPGATGKAVIEFYNPNTVVLRSEYITLDSRVTAIENRLHTAGIA